MRDGGAGTGSGVGGTSALFRSLLLWREHRQHPGPHRDRTATRKSSTDPNSSGERQAGRRPRRRRGCSDITARDPDQRRVRCVHPTAVNCRAAARTFGPTSGRSPSRSSAGGRSSRSGFRPGSQVWATAAGRGPGNSSDYLAPHRDSRVKRGPRPPPEGWGRTRMRSVSGFRARYPGLQAGRRGSGREIREACVFLLCSVGSNVHPVSDAGPGIPVAALSTHELYQNVLVIGQ